MRKDPFRLHRLALAPFLDSDQPVDFPSLLTEAEEDGINNFLQFLIFNGLAPLWHEALINYGQQNKVDSIFTEKLYQVRLTAEASYLMQKKTLLRVNDTLTSAGIKYAVFKGAHIRELVYENPALRPCTDIDVLVSKQNRDAAINSLKNIGLDYKPMSKNISHEATLIDGTVNVDLHWHIMRPGRMRIEMTELLLNNSKKLEGFVGLSDTASLYVMLVHPVFTKYATAPQSTLIRLVDISRWIKIRQIDWGSVYFLLEQAGNCTAAWIMLEWLKILTQVKPPEPFIERIYPGRLRSNYMKHWIINDLSSRYLNHPIITQVAFTLPAHDKFSDASRAVIQLINDNISAKKT